MFSLIDKIRIYICDSWKCRLQKKGNAERKSELKISFKKTQKNRMAIVGGWHFVPPNP